MGCQLNVEGSPSEPRPPLPLPEGSQGRGGLCGSLCRAAVVRLVPGGEQIGILRLRKPPFPPPLPPPQQLILLNLMFLLALPCAFVFVLNSAPTCLVPLPDHT